MTDEKRDNLTLRQYRSHPRHWRENHYVYPVISRRSGGLSIGVNLNPDTACNFDCIYCQVDRMAAPHVRGVDVARLGEELGAMIHAAVDGSLFDDPAFADVPPDKRSIKDIALSGDGEPTTCKVFFESVGLIAGLKRDAGMNDTKIVLITDACYLTKPRVAAALAVMDENDGEIWAKLDAGTESYFRMINRPNVTLQHVVENIIEAARGRPIVIQSLFMRLDGERPDDAELSAYIDRLNEITAAGGKVKCVQVYTVARRPAESRVTALTADEVDHIVQAVRDGTGLRCAAYY
jgi:wyosine [tRNA(Phe)-imidazoG37] synthetase (radical SAM superfamily)